MSPDADPLRSRGSTGGSLCVVGTGIQLMGQVTLESKSAMSSASKLLYVVTDPVTKTWLAELNSTAEDLVTMYGEGKPRIDTYKEMIDRILHFVRAGERVCVAFYGHPGVFVYPGFEAIRLARAECYPATMLPGISAEDCLFADLGIDPGSTGCQSFEATDFLIYSRVFDKRTPLVLWQISCVGQLTHELSYSVEGLSILAEELSKSYGPDHEATVYEAARYPVCPPVMRSIKIGELAQATVSGVSTLVVLPQEGSYADLDMVRRLGISESHLLTSD